ncbi:glycoside hydrolase family 16 protein [Pedobacter sp. AW31-3R]|uniref:glycoside hydrolase family 16 protein n=1 Tax=Pedobacter sp. AW31-3R TaxID=3445781 RepID=UPI003F9F6F17
MKRYHLKYFLSALLLSSVTFTACSQQAAADKSQERPVQNIAKGPYIFEIAPAWSEEFEYTGIPDQAKWKYDRGGGGWYNHEKQYYSDREENVKVEDGKLKITAIRKNAGPETYTSGKITTKGKQSFLYGRVEARLKVPQGRGTWPALWMLSTNDAYGYWPNSGEIDIMEHVGYQPNVMHMTIHNKAANAKDKAELVANKSKTIPTAITAFHVYRLDWTPEAIRGYIDDELLLEYKNTNKGFESWPFDKEFYLLLNLAIGGDWGGVEGIDNDIFPATYEVDYVRYYKMKNN